jgi:hypothetical protein
MGSVDGRYVILGETVQPYTKKRSPPQHTFLTCRE